MEQVQALKRIVSGGGRMVFFGGAGTSTASGIPDFRGRGGLYSQKWEYPPEMLLSAGCLQSCPERFFAFHRENLMPLEAQPNAAHTTLARLEQEGRLQAVITQNVDGLHQKAGSKRVLELHGSIYRNYCMDCGRRYGPEHILECEGVPRCACGGMVRPDVVLYGETLDSRVVARAVEAIRGADVLIVGGTSLTVYPAAGFLDEFSGDFLVIINRDPTGRDSLADLVLYGDVSELLGAL